MQSLYSPKTEFFGEAGWKLFSACDGETDIDWDALTDEQRQKYDNWEKGGFIRRARSSERLNPEQEYRFYPARFKQGVQWSITGHCNYRCRHCFMSAPHAAQGEPTWEQLMTMLDAFERCGIKSVNLTGGEPMVRRDFWALVDEIRARDIIIPTMYSNGLLITDAFLNELEKCGLYLNLQFSFDGAGYREHGAVPLFGQGRLHHRGKHLYRRRYDEADDLSRRSRVDLSSGARSCQWKEYLI